MTLACLQPWIVLQKTSVLRAILRSNCERRASRFLINPVSSFRGSSGGPLQSISTWYDRCTHDQQSLGRSTPNILTQRTLRLPAYSTARAGKMSFTTAYSATTLVVALCAYLDKSSSSSALRIVHRNGAWRDNPVVRGNIASSIVSRNALDYHPPCALSAYILTADAA